jgi:hypothetical protein
VPQLTQATHSRGMQCTLLTAGAVLCVSQAEARVLKAALEEGLNASVFLDSDDLNDLNKLCDHVRASDVLVLLQTRGILTRPWCLLELLTAVEAGVPIVCATLMSPGKGCDSTAHTVPSPPTPYGVHSSH